MIVKVQFIDTAYSSENVPSHLINDSDKISVLKENGFLIKKFYFIPVEYRADDLMKLYHVRVI